MSRRPAIRARRASKGIDGAQQVHRPRPPLLANASGLVWVDRIPGNLIPAVRPNAPIFGTIEETNTCISVRGAKNAVTASRPDRERTCA